MSIFADQDFCSVCLGAPVPTDLQTAGLCLEHYAVTVQRTCAVMHRQVSMHNVSAEYRKELATYIVESALLLSRVASGIDMSIDLKSCVLETFCSLMNLLEGLDDPAYFHLLGAAVPSEHHRRQARA